MSKKNNNQNIEKKFYLKVKSRFTDKYNSEKHYNVGDILEVDEARAEELLKHKGNLVEVEKIIENEIVQNDEVSEETTSE